jgi:hypothetical protein
MSIMKFIKKAFVTFSFALFLAAPLMTVAAPVPVMASDACDNAGRILLMPPWYRGLTDNNCNVISPSDTLPGASAPIGIGGFIWHIALNIIEIGLFIAGYVAFFFILYGGFLFLTGGSNPTQIENARKTLINAAVGFAISTAAIGATNLIFRLING